MIIIYFSSPLGETIAQLTDVASLDHPESDSHITIFTDKTGVVKAARLLLSSVTKVLVLADRVVIKQIITSRNKVFVVFFIVVVLFNWYVQLMQKNIAGWGGIFIASLGGSAKCMFYICLHTKYPK